MPLVSAHAGAVQSEILTLAHYEQALSTGADLIEIDVRQTADGVLIAHHDDLVAGELVAAVPFAEIPAPVAAIPRLLDVIELTRGKVRLHVDIKDAAVKQVFRQFEVGGLAPADFMVTSLDDLVVLEVKQSWPEVTAGLSLGLKAPSKVIRTRLSELWPLRRAQRCRADFLASHFRLARLGVLRRAAAQGYPIFVWTINERPDLVRFLSDPRTTGIVTDQPALAVALRAEVCA
jgi:glycerophosphoryl diester phosphodiesterase